MAHTHCFKDDGRIIGTQALSSGYRCGSARGHPARQGSPSGLAFSAGAFFKGDHGDRAQRGHRSRARHRGRSAHSRSGLPVDRHGLCRGARVRKTAGSAARCATRFLLGYSPAANSRSRPRSAMRSAQSGEAVIIDHVSEDAPFAGITRRHNTAFRAISRSPCPYGRQFLRHAMRHRPAAGTARLRPRRSACSSCSPN